MLSREEGWIRDGKGGKDRVTMLPAVVTAPRSAAASKKPCESARAFLLEGGSTLAEAVMPLTRPRRAEQLALFGD